MSNGRDPLVSRRKPAAVTADRVHGDEGRAALEDDPPAVRRPVGSAVAHRPAGQGDGLRAVDLDLVEARVAAGSAPCEHDLVSVGGPGRIEPLGQLPSVRPVCAGDVNVARALDVGDLRAVGRPGRRIAVASVRRSAAAADRRSGCTDRCPRCSRCSGYRGCTSPRARCPTETSPARCRRPSLHPGAGLPASWPRLGRARRATPNRRCPRDRRGCTRSARSTRGTAGFARDRPIAVATSTLRMSNASVARFILRRYRAPVREP